MEHTSIRGYAFGAIGFLCLFLIACVGQPTEPYWEDRDWLYDFKGSLIVEYPRAAADQGWPAGTALVGFDYEDGYVKNVQIVKSTGYSLLDDAILHEFPAAATHDWKMKQKRALHHFEIEYAVNPGPGDFVSVFVDRIRKQVTGAPEFAHLSPAPSDLEYVKFDYQDGRILGPKVVRSSGRQDVDDMAVAEMLKMPPLPPPSWLRGKRSTYSISFCFSNEPADCKKFGPVVTPSSK